MIIGGRTFQIRCRAARCGGRLRDGGSRGGCRARRGGGRTAAGELRAEQCLIAGHDPADRALRALVGELTAAFDTLTLASAPDVRIVTYLTDPGTPSADALDILRSWVATTSTVSAPSRSSEPSRQPSTTSGPD
jgi:hypothetical protein